MTATPRPVSVSVSEPTLYVAFELSKREWKLALTPGWGVRPWLRTVASGDWRAVVRVLEAARQRFTLAPTVPVRSCYEAGRDGFWIHRGLARLEVTNLVVDSASLEVNRRARRAKTDRMDALQLVRMLVRWSLGERDVWRVVRVPSEAVEAARHASRERAALLREQTRLTNQMRGWLALAGTTLPRRRIGAWWATVRDWAGAALPAEVQARLARAHARWTLLATQLATIATAQATATAQAPAESARGRLVHLKGVATTSVAVLLEEGLVWRQFTNRRQLGGILGFAPTPYQSGPLVRELGISRAGNARLQAVMVQLAWQWVRWQRGSPITQWFAQRYARGSGRLRRIGIVAVARRLLIALWRYATTGAVPVGACLKPA